MVDRKPCRRFISGAAVIFLVLQPAAAEDLKASSEPAWEIPDIDALPDDAQSRLIRDGNDLIAKTYAHIGPEVADPAKRYAGNNLACRTCHLEDGLKKFGLPLWGLKDLYPKDSPASGSRVSLQDRINECVTLNLNGRALPSDSPEMKAMMAYLDFLSTGLKPGERLAGYGSGEMPELDRPADPRRGAAVYQEACGRCHGANGEGLRKNPAQVASGYVAPPLWGTDSFSDGSSMNRLITAANFTHSNMPNGTTYDVPRLSVEDSWDVAAFMLSKPRPHRQGLDKDYPDLLRKPVDTPYGPYADHFSQERHIYGPFKPIREELARLKAAKTP